MSVMFGWIRAAGARRVLAPGLALILLMASACGGDLQDLEAEAESLFAAGQPEEALSLLRDAARKDPENGDIQMAIGLALLQLGRPSEAVFPLSKAAEFEELRATAGLILASTFLKGENLEQAIATTEKVLEVDPSNETALVIRSNAALQLHRGDTALDSADRLVAMDPESANYRHLRALALAESDRLDDAEALVLDIMDDPGEDTAPETLQRACASLVVAMANAEEPERGLAQAKDCEARFGTGSEFARAMAAAYDKLGRGDEAIDLLRRSLAENPDAHGIRAALGTRLIAADSFSEAEELVMEVVDQQETPQRWSVVAQVRTQAGNLAGALEAISRAIELSAEPDQEHLFVRADLLVTLGDLEAAEARRAELTEPLYAQIIEARLHFEHGRPEQALELYEKVLGSWPQNHGVRVFAALAALDLGDRKRARTQLVEATRQAPKETDAAIWLARLRFADGEYEGAAFMANRQIEERGPTHPDAYLLGARAYARLGRTKNAAAFLSAMAEARDGRFKADAVAELGRLVGTARGVAEYEKLAKEYGIDFADPESEPALTQLVQLLKEEGRLDEARERLLGFVKTYPDRPALRALLGRVELLQGDVAAATRAVDKALELDPELATALAAKALLLHSQGDLAGAATAIDAAFAQTPHPDYGYMGARMQLDLGNQEEARDRLLALLRGHPDHAAAANDLAWLLADRGERLALAEDYAQLALRLSPSAAVLDTLGYVQLKRGRADTAIESLGKAVEAKPDYATARYHLALALKETGKTEEARAQLEVALQTAFPESEQARELLARLPEAATQGSLQ
ncbi:MAG: tetratricopeptide repeat protein [Myxococcota bacterium]|nr:tetratricopeptide repeat protein [Myxococcota bacterium]